MKLTTNNKNNLARRLAVLALALGLVLTLAAAAQARGDMIEQTPVAVPMGGSQSMSGNGLGTFPGCPPGSDLLTVSGSGSGGIWTITYSIQSLCDGWTNTATMTGAWSPATGGCFTFNFFYQLCMTNPVGDPSTAAVYSYSNSFDANTGSVLVRFA
jgi:hypothetical protein